jgi:hypothetical protein
MPQTQPADPGTRRERVPVGIFLPDPHRFRISRRRGRLLAAWQDLEPWNVAHLIAEYSRAGDVVIDGDGHSTISLAARYLHRYPATVTTDADRSRLQATLGGRRAFRRRHGAGLVLATLPGTPDDGLGPTSLIHMMRAWGRLLSPGGFLLAALPAVAGVSNAGSVRSAVITAARSAGLVYQQHLLVVTRRLLEEEPRARPDTAAATRPALRQGRHARVHRDLLAFVAATTREETTHV